MQKFGKIQEIISFEIALNFVEFSSFLFWYPDGFFPLCVSLRRKPSVSETNYVRPVLRERAHLLPGQAGAVERRLGRRQEEGKGPQVGERRRRRRRLLPSGSHSRVAPRRVRLEKIPVTCRRVTAASLHDETPLIDLK